MFRDEGLGSLGLGVGVPLASTLVLLEEGLGEDFGDDLVSRVVLVHRKIAEAKVIGVVLKQEHHHTMSTRSFLSQLQALASDTASTHARTSAHERGTTGGVLLLRKRAPTCFRS